MVKLQDRTVQWSNYSAIGVAYCNGQIIAERPGLLLVVSFQPQILVVFKRCYYTQEVVLGPSVPVSRHTIMKFAVH